jgi:hypothetical protein
MAVVPLCEKDALGLKELLDQLEMLMAHCLLTIRRLAERGSVR